MMAAHAMSERKREKEKDVTATLEWTVNCKSTFGQPWLPFAFAHAKPAFVPHNKANNKLNM